MPAQAQTNKYSTNWFDIFLSPSETTPVDREIEFIQYWYPRPQYRTLLDVCCGIGRHGKPLSRAGYAVVGLDVNEQALKWADKTRGTAHYIRADMREMPFEHDSFDGIICLWQSFGYFDASTNHQVLEEMKRILRPKGRLILDIYHRMFFTGREGTRSFSKGQHHLTERKQMNGNRLEVELQYRGRAESDHFDWQLYDPDELCELARQIGLSTLLVCSEFNQNTRPTAELPRMQLVFQKEQV